MIRFNKVTFLFAKIAMQSHSPGLFCSNETSMLPVSFLSISTKRVEPRPIHIIPSVEEWEPRVLLYLASANTALNRDLNSSSYTRRALWIFPFMTRDAWPTMLQLVQRATEVNYIYWAQAIPRFVRATKSGKLRWSCSSVVFFSVLNRCLLHSCL